jgi:hypothetical protein
MSSGSSLLPSDCDVVNGDYEPAVWYTMRRAVDIVFLIGYGAVAGFNVGDEKPPHY